MKQMTLANIAAACGGRYHGDPATAEVEVTGITSDSRKVEPGFLFAALKGERVDGHAFVAQVFEKGAAAVLVEDAPAEAKGPYIQVASCYQALKDIAEFYRKTLTIPVVGIVGSVGKTSTKEMIASVLEQKFRVCKTEGNFNNELGVPLTVFRIREDDQVAVLEMGISDFGEMHRLSRITRPDICVMTNIGLCHLDHLHSRDGVLKAKSEVFDYAAPGCVACLNGDDDKLRTLENRGELRPCFFGMGAENDIHAEQVENRGLDGIDCDICTKAGSIRVHIPIPGMHMVYNALAGTAVGLTLGLTLEEIKAGIEALQPTGGRNHIVHMGTYTVIDDCYNANPVSMGASLDVLKCALGHTVALLGDMGELGADEAKLHYGVGVHAAENGIQKIVCVGALSKHMAAGARSVAKESQEVVYFPAIEDLLEHLGTIVQPGDTVLVKASHFMHFEKVVEALRLMGN